ncbi:MAG: phosphoenolpyruvate carboxykinase (GTP) [Deltaproteobacteria bacterium]|nr:phosphoenolpyruvate carboxykinase (GTP) [Deltaproteobacteria bacterium]
MGPQKDVIDIVTELGGVKTPEAAREVFENKLDAVNLSKLNEIKNEAVRLKIANAIVLCGPDSVFIDSGSEEDRQYIRDLSLEKGEESKLPMEGHTIHYDLKEEQEAFEDIRDKMTGIMNGKQMLIGFYIRGPVGAPASNPAVEITSSTYVLHSADILYRNVFSLFDREAENTNHFYANIHSEGLNRSEDLPNARVFMDRSHLTTYSFNCTYAGNTLLMKKGNHRFSVDRSVYEKREEQLAEHMFVTGINGPGGRITWMIGAAPSGCGKTTSAMAGDHFVGDDLAQLWIAEDGSVRSINPEAGIFGIVEDVNWEGDPVLMECLRPPGTEVIFSNVLIDDNRVPQWVGNNEDPPPTKGVNFQGPWEQGMVDANGKEIPMSHPNSRCTLKNTALGNYSDKNEDPAGVETRIVTYSGRDSDTMPPVWVAKDSDRGVVIGACIVSAATATEVGATGVRRQPWANAPFIPGSLGDYMEAQFQFFGSLNYFLTEEARGGTSQKLLGEKRDVKAWMAWLERRAHSEFDAIETPVGYLPKYEDLKNLFKSRIDKEYPEDLYVKQFSLYIDNIVARVDLQIEAYGKEKNIPQKLFDILKAQRQELTALKEKFGPIVTPKQLEEAQ